MTSELLPCPFCGSEARPALENDEWVECSSADCDAMQSGAAPHFDAIDAWNTRAEAALAALKAEVVEVVGFYAEPANWKDFIARPPGRDSHYHSAHAHLDEGSRARDLLAKLKGEG